MHLIVQNLEVKSLKYMKLKITATCFGSHVIRNMLQ